MSQKNDLSKLSNEMFILIRNGIYSLYEIVGSAEANYALVTNDRKMYILSKEGEVLKEVDSLAQFNLRKTSLDNAQVNQTSIKLNYA